MSDLMVFDRFGRPRIKDGKLLLDDGAGNFCCCPRCVVTYQAIWDCNAQAWIYGAHTASCYLSPAPLPTDDTWVLGVGSPLNPGLYCTATRRHITNTNCPSGPCEIPSPPPPLPDPPPDAVRCQWSGSAINGYCWAKLGCHGIFVTFSGVTGSSCVRFVQSAARWGSFDAGAINGNTYDLTPSNNIWAIDAHPRYVESDCSDTPAMVMQFGINIYVKLNDGIPEYLYLLANSAYELVFAGRYFFPLPGSRPCEEPIVLTNDAATPGDGSAYNNSISWQGAVGGSVGNAYSSASGGMATLVWH